MTSRERLSRTLQPDPQRPPDRLPLVEWAGYWEPTIERWEREADRRLSRDSAELRAELGLDHWLQYWIRPRGEGTPRPAHFGGALIADEDEYERAAYLYPEQAVPSDLIGGWADEHANGGSVVWATVEGFFWFPRTLFGIEEHLYAFYDAPELVHRMNRDLLEFNLRAIDEFCAIATPDFVTVAEDMSYNHGPMLSRQLFDEFLAPYYRRLTAALHARGVPVLVDSDGDVAELVPWLEAVGVDGILPLERASGVDASAIRAGHPRFVMLGAYDKRVMQHGEAAMRAEFERLLPLMEGGRFIPSVDHQTPPDVSLEHYRLYVSLLTEYARRAVGPAWGRS